MKCTFLGAVRVFEFRKKAGAPNFIRFPLFPGAVFSVKLVFIYFPGSLLLMEGAVQEDWLHCLPKVEKKCLFTSIILLRNCRTRPARRRGWTWPSGQCTVQTMCLRSTWWHQTSPIPVTLHALRTGVSVPIKVSEYPKGTTELFFDFYPTQIRPMLAEWPILYMALRHLTSDSRLWWKRGKNGEFENHPSLVESCKYSEVWTVSTVKGHIFVCLNTLPLIAFFQLWHRGTFSAGSDSKTKDWIFFPNEKNQH